MRYKKPPHKKATYHLPGGQSDSLARFNMRARMNGLDIVFAPTPIAIESNPASAEGLARLKLPNLLWQPLNRAFGCPAGGSQHRVGCAF
jgi:hypothetical protein